jgi:hypothetical protein
MKSLCSKLFISPKDVCHSSYDSYLFFKIFFCLLFRILTTMNSADSDLQKPGVLIINELMRSVKFRLF